MFRRKQKMQNFYFQQDRMDHVNMGNPYFSSSPYPYFQSIPNPYYQQQPPIPNYYPSNNGWNVPQPQYQNIHPSSFIGGKNSVQSIFHNPLEPKDPYASQMQMPNQQMYFNPYPKPNAIQKPSGGFGSIINSFKGQDGNVDLNKMMNTAGQMVNAVSQVSSMVKGLGIFKV